MARKHAPDLRASTVTLPVELLDLVVFHSACLRDVLPWLFVCRSTREAAIRAPAYWQFIRWPPLSSDEYFPDLRMLRGFLTGPPALLLERRPALDVDAPPLHVTLKFECERYHEELEVDGRQCRCEDYIENVLGVLDNLAHLRLVTLNIDCGASGTAVYSVLHRLRHAALQLCRLSVIAEVQDDDDWGPTEVALFEGTAPSLTYLELSVVQITTDRVAAFDCVETLELDCSEIYQLSPRVCLAGCLNLEHLVLRQVPPKEFLLCMANGLFRQSLSSLTAFSLHLQQLHGYAPELLQAIVAAVPHALKSVILYAGDHAWALPGDAVRALLQSLPELQDGSGLHLELRPHPHPEDQSHQFTFSAGPRVCTRSIVLPEPFRRRQSAVVDMFVSVQLSGVDLSGLESIDISSTSLRLLLGLRAVQPCLPHLQALTVLLEGGNLAENNSPCRLRTPSLGRLTLAVFPCQFRREEARKEERLMSLSSWLELPSTRSIKISLR